MQTYSKKAYTIKSFKTKVRIEEYAYHNFKRFEKGYFIHSPALHKSRVEAKAALPLLPLTT